MRGTWRSSGGANEGARGQALDLVSERIAAGGVAPSDGIVGVLAKTLTTDRNPGVRKKAAVTLKDRPSIETLQEKANDERENGYLRVKAASALGRLAL